MSRNLLAEETSPYLLQHATDPVHWRPWGQAALDEARSANKPVLLSAGYLACHWCQVMTRESFTDADTAALINDNYVPVMVDREERPDIDIIYQAALAAMGQGGGWPLTMFLTPNGEPFAGGTYFPTADSVGRPSFRKVLTDVAKVWAEQPPELLKTRETLLKRLNDAWAGSRAGDVSRVNIDFAARRIAQGVDMFMGGLDGSQKFPQAPLFETLWRAYLRTGARPFGQAVTTTLDYICQGGLHDHLGGGFARYATDEMWRVPSFEKLLCDNALLIDLLTLVWQQTRAPLYAQRIAETVDWMLREMALPDGGFATSLDGTSEGEEGKYYLWTEAEIDAVLGGDTGAIFKRAYEVTPQGNWNGQTVLHRLRALNYLPPEQEAMLAGQRRQLLKARNARTRPARDDKAMADWNGLAIAALANAAAVFQKPEWHLAAAKAFQFVVEKMATGSDGAGLVHTWANGRQGPPGLAEDYANMARAALALFEITQDRRYLERARAWTKTLDSAFWDNGGGGYYTSPDTAEGLIARVRQPVDHPVPSANGVMVSVLARLAAITGDRRLRTRAAEIVKAFGGDIQRNYVGCPTLLNGFELLLAQFQIIVVRAPGDVRVQPLLRTIYEKSLPTRMLQVVSPEAGVPEGHPAHGKPLVNGLPTVYLCVGDTCSQPITDAAALDQALGRPYAAA